MRNVLGLKVETKMGLVIIIMVIIIFSFAIFKSMDDFSKLIDKFNQYEKLLIKEGE